MAGVCTGNGPCDVHPTGHGGDNFVTRGGGFDPYLRAIINALKRKGHSESQAVQIAIGTVQRWARGEGSVSAATRARAAKSLARWEALRAKAHALTADPAATVDLALSPADKASVDRETARIRLRAAKATFPHKFAAANWTHPNGHPRCKNCGQEEPVGGMCTKPSEKPTAGPATSISMTAASAATIDLAASHPGQRFRHGWIPVMPTGEARKRLTKALVANVGAAIGAKRKHGEGSPEHKAALAKVEATHRAIRRLKQS